MTVITKYKGERIVAPSWAEATYAIVQMVADEARLAALSDYRGEMPDIDFDQEEWSA